MINDAENHNNLVRRYGVWHTDFVDPMGKRVRVSLKIKDRKLAELKVKKMQIEAYEKGSFEMKKPTRMRFEDLAPKILEYAKERRRCYKKIYLPVMNHLVAFFGNKYLHEITVNMVNDYQSERKKLVSAVTVNKEVQILHRCFNIAIQWGLFYSNPVKGIEYFKIPKSRIRFLTVEEIQRLLQNCGGYIKEIILTALHTGGRKSEILGLRWVNIDFDNKLVVYEQTKNDEVRQIPMTEALFEMLSNKRSANPKDDYVFVGKNGRPLGNVDKSFKTARKTAKIENCRFHDLRHTYASQLVMSGADILTVKELMGHKDLKTTLIYAHLAPKHKREAVRVYENYLGKIVKLRHVYGTKPVLENVS